MNHGPPPLPPSLPPQDESLLVRDLPAYETRELCPRCVSSSTKASGSRPFYQTSLDILVFVYVFLVWLQTEDQFAFGVVVISLLGECIALWGEHERGSVVDVYIS